MSIEQDLRSHLTGHAGVSALAGGRIYPMRLPQKATLPAITYQRISGPRVHSHSGASGLAHPRYQLNCWAESYGDAAALAEQVRLALDGSGAIGASFVDNDIDDHDPETGLYRRIVDVVIWHREAVA